MSNSLYIFKAISKEDLLNKFHLTVDESEKTYDKNLVVYKDNDGHNAGFWFSEDYVNFIMETGDCYEILKNMLSIEEFNVISDEEPIEYVFVGPSEIVDEETKNNMNDLFHLLVLKTWDKVDYKKASEDIDDKKRDLMTKIKDKRFKDKKRIEPIVTETSNNGVDPLDEMLRSMGIK